MPSNCYSSSAISSGASTFPCETTFPFTSSAGVDMIPASAIATGSVTYSTPTEPSAFEAAAWAFSWSWWQRLQPGPNTMSVTGSVPGAAQAPPQSHGAAASPSGTSTIYISQQQLSFFSSLPNIFPNNPISMSFL